MEFNYKHVLIYGNGKSGRAVESVLKDLSIDYDIYDDNKSGTIKKIKNLRQYDLLVISPAVSVYNKIVVKAKKLGIKVISELEFGFYFVSAPIIAITGTNGKTTTTMLVKELLTRAGYKCDAFGNIGNPLSQAYQKDYDYIVCEVSSFQLEAVENFAPDIAIMTNLDADHIDRHKTFENYVLTKQRLFSKCNYAIINKECDFFTLCDKTTFNDDKIFVSKKYIIDGDERIDVSKLIKSTYADNILATYLVAKKLNIDFNLITNFKLPHKHRLEHFLTYKQIKFFNDSKATNPHSVINSLNKINGDIVLLLGGQNKDINFTNFVSKIPFNVRICLLFGKARKELAKACKKVNRRYLSFATLEGATKFALKCAVRCDNVVLSPACASFDEFKDYEERGDYFKKLVIGTLKNEKK